MNHYYGESNSWGAGGGDMTTFHNGSTPGTTRLAAMKFFSASLVMRRLEQKNTCNFEQTTGVVADGVNILMFVSSKQSGNDLDALAF